MPTKTKVVSKVKKPAPNRAAKTSPTWLRSVKWLTSYVLTLILGAVLLPVFVGLLPGPNAQVTMTIERADSGNAAGCTFYAFMLSAAHPEELDGGDSIEDAYFEVQLPERIVDSHVSFSAESLGPEFRVHLQAWEMTRNPGGECAIRQAATTDNQGLVTSTVGHLLRVRTGKLPPHAVIAAMYAVPTTEAELPLKLHFEGSYEYMKLGQLVKKDLTFTGSAVPNSMDGSKNTTRP